MSVYKAYYRGERIDFTLPKDWTLIGIGEPNEAPPLKRVRAELKRTLDNPVGTESLRSLASSAHGAVIISDDHTRPTPTHILLPSIMNQLNEYGMPDDSIAVVVGRGTHRQPSKEEVKAKLGEEVVKRVRVEVHDPDDRRSLTFLGNSERGTPIWINKTVYESDLKIGVGNIAPHYFAGYGGGGKIILPGVSGRETIVKNHTLIGDSSTIQGKLGGNIIYSDMLDVARRAGLNMKVDVILNMENKVAGISTGEVGAEHTRGIQSFNEIYGFRAPGKADVTITCGYPLETNLIQSSKAVLSADLVTKEGGTIILVSACHDGPGRGLYETLREKPDPEEVIRWIAAGKALPSGGPIAARTRAILKTKDITVVTEGVDHEKLVEMGMEPYFSLRDALENTSKSKKRADVMILPTGSSINPLV